LLKDVWLVPRSQIVTPGFCCQNAAVIKAPRHEAPKGSTAQRLRFDNTVPGVASGCTTGERQRATRTRQALADEAVKSAAGFWGCGACHTPINNTLRELIHEYENRKDFQNFYWA